MSETWLSRDAYDRLKAELEHLKTEGRTSIAAIIETARSHGDIRENAEFDAAKDEQGKMEARIRQLQQLLRDAQVSDATPTEHGGAAAPGHVVTVEIDGDEETFLLVG
ncbi:MAG TPA: transcription elongation factor GreA, partial [Solirubrobacteraceae bacterium]|nr:transcription elongation factor GreA [Solirubrobacteraceae bacterium]